MRSLAAAVSILMMIMPALAAETNAPPPPQKSRIQVETIAKGLVHPWALQFLPDGRMLITERPGRMRIVSQDGKLSPPLERVPKVVAQDQGGLLDVALAPDYAQSGVIFFSYSEPRGRGGNGTAVARARLVTDGNGGRLEDLKVIFQQQPARASNLHFGSRLVFASDGTLFVTLGERYHYMQDAQDLGSHLGKIVRIYPDGSVPKDNPFVGRDGAKPETWSYGHRNIQSAAIHPRTGKLWIIEHGAKGGDEINIPEAGRNYGWPVISYGRHYSGAKIGVGTHKEGMEQPIYYWDPSIAPSGAAFYTGDLIPQWKGNLFVGALVLEHLTRLVLDGSKVVAEERLLTDLGERIRDVRQGPDGALYVLTDNARGRILRLLPGAESPK
jgi:glucose/arabinose dehydrogenase